MTPTDALGWGSSVVLVATIAKQVYRQWAAGTSEGVSRWLFAGQIVASSGFTAYSAIVGNAVFVITNAVMLCAAFVGLGIVVYHRQKGARAERPGLNVRGVTRGRRGVRWVRGR